MEVVLTPRALRDLDDIWDHIASDKPVTADQVARRINERYLQLGPNPHLGPRRPQLGAGVRVLTADRWLVMYRIVGDRVVIGRIVDGARDLRRVRVPKR